jgi:hypothetical protein
MSRVFTEFTMKRGIALAVWLICPLGALAQSPIMTVLNNGEPPSSDLALKMEAGFIRCDSEMVVPRSLASLGVRFAPDGAAYAPVGAKTRARLLLEPNGPRDPSPVGGNRSAVGTYQLTHAVSWQHGIQVLKVAQETTFEVPPGELPVESVTLTFNVDAAAVIEELDKRSDGIVSARLDRVDASGIAFHRVASDRHALQCVRHPDLEIGE